MSKAKNKTVATDASVDAFLDKIENEQKQADCKKICTMMERLSGETPKM